MTRVSRPVAPGREGFGFRWSADRPRSTQALTRSDGLHVRQLALELSFRPASSGWPGTADRLPGTAWRDLRAWPLRGSERASADLV